MTICGTCRRSGWTFHVTWVDGSGHDFDSVACALNVLAPECDACGVRILDRPQRMTSGVFCSQECVDAAWARASWMVAPGDAEPDSIGSTPPRCGPRPTPLSPPRPAVPEQRERHVVRASQLTAD